MAFNSSAWGNDGGTYGEDSMRDLVAALSGGQAGVVGDSDALAVSQQGTPAATVKVAAGGYVIPATAAGETGSYTDWNDADLTSPAFTPTGVGVSRKDRLIIRVTAGVSALEIVEGTAAASPTEPSITGDNYLELALVTIPASTSNITDAMITDRRTRLSAGSPAICTSTTRPADPWTGLRIFETDTGREYAYYAAAWKYLNSTSREHTISAVYVPAGNDDTTTASPTYGDWGGTVNITVPPWATKARVTATAAGVFPQTASGSVIDLRIRIGSDFSQSFRFTTYGAADTPRESLTFTGEVTLTSSGTKSLRVEESRVSGTGSFRADTNSDFTFAVDFLP